MEAGTKLDALIAEHVMGFELVLGDDKRITAAPYVKYYVRHEYAPKSGEEVFHKNYIVCREDLIPKYSTRIAAAWEVIDKMETYFKIEYLSGRKRYLVEAGPEYVQAMAETAPHAICIAALKAKGVEV